MSRPQTSAYAASPSLLPYPPNSPLSSPRIHSHPILLQPLPPASALAQESTFQSELELDRQTRQIKQEKELQEALQDQQWSVERAQVRDQQGTWSKHQKKPDLRPSISDKWGQSQAFAHPPQAWELYRAIDKHDIEFIMRIRDHSFKMLLQKSGPDFPIVYAARLGPQWRDIVIILVGALSRYVNHLDPEDFEKKETKDILKGLRVNLKLAIDYSLHSSSPHLLASYLQVLIMSEGDEFIHKSISSLALLFRSSPLNQTKPVQSAEDTVRRFCTKQLREVQEGVAEVEEYVANAVLDLVIMAVWSLVAGELGLERLPTHTFARDLRTFQTFSEHLSDPETTPKLPKLKVRTRKMVNVLKELAGDNVKGVRGRLRDVRETFDEGVL
ncbi:hypothetical protein L198_07387 [Cryptococcus wingfieldii CBS 7118]|uniref:Uncharacterized protein n=1 Tax=Cryptococcus wingfieldii CBS 7118 TaxID=1295528 RepID=A0A1E3IBW3_9TREE|nr:hypothetical protein L198_07387 [Cryptococcus wingfieldii CBS 7118]ODN86094.1 hypothetical protein L198_07387 [Cryptococcus wingfieldii CBS 7118]